jgi:hypothetical protein
MEGLCPALLRDGAASGIATLIVGFASRWIVF